MVKLEVRRAPKSTTTCWQCKQKIKLYAYRFTVTAYGTRSSTTRRYHLLCTNWDSNYELSLVKMLDAKGYQLDAGEKEEVRKILNEKIIMPFKIKRASIPINKHIHKMTVDELKQELRKRGLKCSGRSDVLQGRLIDFFQSDISLEIQKERNEKLVKGYSKRLLKKERIHLPLCLQHTIIKYFPTMTL